MGITDIAYNYLNLPKKFVQGSRQLVYLYDATGRKLKKTLGNAVTDYVEGIQYKNGVLEFIQTEEGRILPSGSSFVYEYFLRDHLGNTRAIVDHTGAVKQIQDYYAFGMEMNTGAGLNSASNHYKYNSKEKQVELGLDQLDYGARFYDAEIGRWNVVDPLAEQFENVSPYNYAMNNPILMVDPTGMAADTSGFFNQVIETVVVTAKKVDNFRWPTWTYHVPILGSAAESGNNLADGRPLAAAGNFGTSLAELFTVGSLSQFRIGTKMMSSASDDLLTNGLKLRQGAKEAFKKHALANGRHNDLGISGEKLVENAFKLIENNKSLLKSGDNTLTGTINGIQKSFKAFVKDGEIMSVNMYPRVSDRVTDGTTIKFGDILWK